MKTNTTIILSIVLPIVVALVSCKKPSIKPDLLNPALPSYSEQGLNVGGILINDSVWLTLKPGLFSTAKPVGLICFPKGDSIVVFLNGSFKDGGLKEQKVETIFVVIKGVRIVSDNDLLQLNDHDFTLDGSTNYGGFLDHVSNKKNGRATGNIGFGKVSVMNHITYGDGSANNPILHPYIFSGKLNMNFRTTRDFSLTRGRFDMTLLRNSNFEVVYN